LKEKGWTLAKWQKALLDIEREVHLDRLARGDPSYLWPWLCVSPQCSDAAIVFLFVLYLWQEQMIELTDEVWAFVKDYLHPFLKQVARDHDVGQTRDHRNTTAATGDPLEGIIWEIFNGIKQHYALQEHWKGLPQYIWRVVRTVMKRNGPSLVTSADPEGVATRQLQQKGRISPGGHESLANRPPTLDQAVRVLARKWLPISRESLYRWIREKKITSIKDERGRIRLDDAGLAKAEALARRERSRMTSRVTDDDQEGV
jgi:hypothetical protein